MIEPEAETPPTDSGTVSVSSWVVSLTVGSVIAKDEMPAATVIVPATGS